jgi:hypothetical protein
MQDIQEMAMPTIHFNGKTYNDLAEMPATEREMYDQLMSVMQDADGNGVPDLFEGDVVSNIIEVVRKSGGDSESIVALEQMSPEMRARLSKGIEMLHKFGLLSEMPKFSSSETTPSWQDAEIRASKPIIASPSAIQEDTGSSRFVILLVILISLGLCMAGVVAFIIYRGGV